MNRFIRFIRSLLRRIPGRRLVSPPSPTDVLTDMLCMRIILERRSIDSMCTRGYYETFLWVHGPFYLQFDVSSYANDAPASVISSLRKVDADGGEKRIELTDNQKARLIAALNRGDRIAREIAEAEQKAQNELLACDALEALLEVKPGEPSQFPMPAALDKPKSSWLGLDLNLFMNQRPRGKKALLETDRESQEEWS